MKKKIIFAARKKIIWVSCLVDNLLENILAIKSVPISSPADQDLGGWGWDKNWVRPRNVCCMWSSFFLTYVYIKVIVPFPSVLLVRSAGCQ